MAGVMLGTRQSYKMCNKNQAFVWLELVLDKWSSNWKTETINSMGTWLFQEGADGLARKKSILWVSITDMLPCFSHCIALIVLIALFLLSCGVCYDRHFISPFQECPLFALAIRPNPVKMTPCIPNWDKSTSAVTVHWGNVGALCFYLLPCAITSAATATSSIHQWHWSKKHCTVPALSCSEPRYRCSLIYITPNCQVCTC